MTQPTVKAIPQGMHTITPHLVVRGAAQAAEWYKEALGAKEQGRTSVTFPRRRSPAWRHRFSGVRDDMRAIGVWWASLPDRCTMR